MAGTKDDPIVMDESDERIASHATPPRPVPVPPGPPPCLMRTDLTVFQPLPERPMKIRRISEYKYGGFRMTSLDLRRLVPTLQNFTKACGEVAVIMAEYIGFKRCRSCPKMLQFPKSMVAMRETITYKAGESTFWAIFRRFRGGVHFEATDDAFCTACFKSMLLMETGYGVYEVALPCESKYQKTLYLLRLMGLDHLRFNLPKVTM